MDEAINEINQTMQELDTVMKDAVEVMRAARALSAYTDRLEIKVEEMTDRLNAALDALGVPERTESE